MDIVKVDALGFAWEPAHPVFNDLAFSVACGETVGLVGPNGAGKTTLFLLLAGVIRPGNGSIEVLGAAPGSPGLRGRIGLVFQGTDEQLFCSTVEEDVAFGPANLGCGGAEVAERVRTALELVGLPGWEGRVPHHLSGGEQRKVAIASVLSMRPELILLDEPTSDLDSRSRRELLRLLAGLPATKVIASHDLEFILEAAGRVAVLAAGRILASGPPDEVFRREDVLARAGLELSRGVRAILGLRGG